MTNAQNRKRWSVNQRNLAREAMAKQIEAERAEREAQLIYLAEINKQIAAATKGEVK
jgi:hypothetical protein